MIRRAQSFVLLFILLGTTVATRGITLQDLRNDPKLTPQRFAAYFSDFAYQYRVEVQTPEVFLATQSGDCDDYATLAALVLREKGYTPRLITVRMKGIVHVVCYIEETRTILDYNERQFMRRTITCSNMLPDIAGKVCKGFNAQWDSVTEFTFEGGVKRAVQTIVEPRLAAVTQLSQASKTTSF